MARKTSAFFFGTTAHPLTTALRWKSRSSGQKGLLPYGHAFNDHEMAQDTLPRGGLCFSA
jgi:hypothetical protein